MVQKRAIVIVLDGCGAGEAPDSAYFGNDDHPSTLLHVWEATGGFKAPTLAACGFLRAGGIIGSHGGSIGRPVRFGRLQEISLGGKDSITGHWEMMGAVTDRPFPTYPQGFPIQLVKSFERAIGTQVLGNRAASGTQIIDELGELHVETGFPILYTSADSVFQLACHESVVPIDRLYEMCRIARELCVAPNAVQRVIARPFVGDVRSGFKRTDRRKDFPLPPPRNLIDVIGDVYGIGAIPDLFAHRGFREVPRSGNNAEHEVELWKALDSKARFIFANFEDFDMLYGHRNDPAGFASALESFDQTLALLLSRLRSDDVLLLTADHGNDPTSTSTDHSREYVPVSVIGPSVGNDERALGDVVGMTAVGATVASHLDIDWPIGTNLLSL